MRGYDYAAREVLHLPVPQNSPEAEDKRYTRLAKGLIGKERIKKPESFQFSCEEKVLLRNAKKNRRLQTNPSDLFREGHEDFT